MTASAPTTARERVRRELTAEIKAVARRHLAEHGSSALSLRAVARELGMASSAVYRYFPSRDDLLTALIIDAYDAIGVAAEQGDPGPGPDTAGRWLEVARSIRTWAIAHPQEYALIYGSPVPGYRAPTDTVDPASRVIFVFLRLVADGVAAGDITGGPDPEVPRGVHDDFTGIRAYAGHDIPDAVVSRSLLVWTQLFGAISFELFGHLHNVIEEVDAFFEVQCRRSAEFLLNGH